MTKQTKETLRLIAKIFIIVGAVLQFYLIYPIILGIFAYRYIDEPNKDGENVSTVKLVWAIITTILVSFVSGVLMLVDIFVPETEEKPEVVEAKESKEE